MCNVEVVGGVHNATMCITRTRQNEHYAHGQGKHNTQKFDPHFEVDMVPPAACGK
jgi:hypothetical protein